MLPSAKHQDTIAELLKLQDELAKSIHHVGQLPAPPAQLFTPAGQFAATHAHDSYQQRLVVGERQISAPVERQAPLLPPTLPGHERPVLQLTGDPAVKREFLDRLMADGRITKSNEREGWLTVRGSMQDLSQRWSEAAAAVATREGRPLAAAAVHVDGARKDWPGGVTFGAASSPQALYAESTRAFVAGLPDGVVTKALDQLARNPTMLIGRDGSIDKDSIRQALNYFTDPRQSPAEAGRSASVGEVASMAVNATYLANLLGKEDVVGQKALMKVATMESVTSQQIGAGTYEAVKSAIGTDLAQAQGRNLQSAVASLSKEDSLQGPTEKPSPALQAQQGRELDR